MNNEQVGYLQGLWLARIAFLIIGILLYNAMRKVPGIGGKVVAAIGGYMAGYSIGAGSSHGLLIGIIGVIAAVCTVHSAAPAKSSADPAVKQP
jgi:hypothetical protein